MNGIQEFPCVRIGKGKDGYSNWMGQPSRWFPIIEVMQKVAKGRFSWMGLNVFPYKGYVENRGRTLGLNGPLRLANDVSTCFTIVIMGFSGFLHELECINRGPRP